MLMRCSKKIFVTLFGCFFTISVIQAQIATNYQVGTWYQFKPAAVSYTFDDNCSNQLPIAMPMFDKYGYKMTFFSVINWASGLWPQLLAASKNGHEIASHTVTHTDLSTMTVANQDVELKNSQATINTNITNAKCVTIAYPNCNIGDLTTIKKYYIAGRICSGQIVAATPSDFYNISSNICGNTGSLQTAQNFNDKVSSALTAKGWCVFLIHGVDGDGGYSPTQSTEISSHLAYMNTNIANYWIGTFGNVVKYIKERNAASLVETTISKDSLQAVVTQTIDSSIYNVPVTFRRVMPTGWAGAKVYFKNTLITSTTVTVSGTTYVMFDAIPNRGNNYIVNTAITTVAAPTVTTPVLYCQSATATALTATGTALKWYTAATGGTALTAAPIPSTTTAGSTTYYVSQTVGGVESSRAAIVVTINALPSAPTVTSPVQYVQAAVATALTATGTSLKWYTAATGGVSLTAAPVPVTTTVGTTNYYVSQTVATCESPRASIAVNITAPVIVTIPLKAGWNYIGCPISATTALASALSSIWSNVLIVKNLDAFYSSTNVPALNTLTEVVWGQGYYVKVSAACNLDWIAR